MFSSTVELIISGVCMFASYCLIKMAHNRSKYGKAFH